MKLEDQVTNLELSKKLKELGVEQDSLWNWVDGYEGPDGLQSKTDWYLVDLYTHERLVNEHNIDFISAFTVAELGEMLPGHISEERSLLYKVGGKYQVAYLGLDKGKNIVFEDETEANARAKCLFTLSRRVLCEVRSK